MRTYLTCILGTLVFAACSGPALEDKKAVGENTVPAKKPSFFPVTSYIRGQLYEVKSKGVNPLHYITINGRKDSSWMRIEDFEPAVAEFLTPQIDSTNLVNLFTEKNFLDQSIAAYTFTYDPAGKLPDTMKLKHWDVYVDAESNKVTRIYMVKENTQGKILQLTWQGDKYCKIVTLGMDASGNSAVEKEEQITWDL